MADVLHAKNWTANSKDILRISRKFLICHHIFLFNFVSPGSQVNPSDLRKASLTPYKGANNNCNYLLSYFLFNKVIKNF